MKIDYGTLKVDQFKALVFVSSLKASEDREIQKRLLNRLEEKPETKLAELRTEAETYEKQRINMRTVVSEEEKLETCKVHANAQEPWFGKKEWKRIRFELRLQLRRK